MVQGREDGYRLVRDAAPGVGSQALGPADMAIRAHIDDMLLVRIDTGESEDTQQAVAAGATLKVTLVWTDPPGDSLQNDLDLIVTTPDGRELHGNVAPGAAGFDHSNNVEQVVVPNIAAGIATITVRAFRNGSPQTFALVVRVS
jgi:serine protease AprX